MSILGQIRGKFGPKRGQKGRSQIFSLTSNINFPQEERKNSIYTKDQQHLMNRLEDIGSNVDFGPKKGQIWTKKGEAEFFLAFKHQFSTRTP